MKCTLQKPQNFWCDFGRRAYSAKWPLEKALAGLKPVVQPFVQQGWEEAERRSQRRSLKEEIPMDMTKIRQLLLVAFSTEHANEAHNALSLVKRQLAQQNKDIHAFVNGIGSAGGSTSSASLHDLQMQV